MAAGLVIRRKLAAFAVSYCAACFAAQYVIPAKWHLYAAITFAAVTFCAFFADKRYKTGILLIVTGLTLGFLWNVVYYKIYFEPAEKLHGEITEIFAESENYSEKTDYGIRVYARLKSQRDIKSLVYLNDKELVLKPGDKISVKARLNISTKLGDDNGLTYFSSKGIFLVAYQDGKSDAVIEFTENIPVKYYPVMILRSVRNRLSLIFDSEITPLMNGVLTGDLSGFSDYFKSSLSVTGLSHVVSVSGMHLAFIVGMINGLLRKKRRASLVSIPVIILFMAVMGGTPSVLRAGIMQIIICIAPLISRENDSPTSLSFALMLILITNPFAAASVSLQLSFGSVAGIMLVSRSGFAGDKELKNTPLHVIIQKVVLFVKISVLTTLGAMMFTLPLTCLYFGKVSLIAPVSNVLTLGVVSLVFTIGTAAVTLSYIYLPFGEILGAFIYPFVKYLIWIIEKLARFPLASINTSNIYLLSWFIYAYFLLWILLLSRGKKYGFPIVCLMICSLCVSLTLSEIDRRRYDIIISVLDVGQGQCVVITSREYTIVSDCGGNKANAGDIAADYIESLNRKKVDFLILSHYHDDHANGIYELWNRMEIGHVLLPEIEDDDDIRAQIIEFAEENNTEVINVASDMVIDFEKTQIFLYTSDFAYSTNEKGVITLCKSGEFEILITGDLNALSEKRLISRAELPDIEMFVAGHHGSKYSTSNELLDKLTPEIAVISSGRNNYGHPAPETLEKLDDYEIKTYRTDLQGTITVRGNIREK